MPEGSNLLADSAVTNSIVSQGYGREHGAMEARLARDSWRIDGRESDRDLAVSHARSEEVRDILGRSYSGSEWANERTRDIMEDVDRVGLTVEKTGAAGILQTHTTAGALGVQAEKNAAATNLTVEKTGAASNLLATQFANQARTDAIQFNAATNLAIEKAAAAAALLATQNAAAAALTAAQNHCDLKATIAECCCELKEQHALTRSRIDGLETDRLRSELNEARSAVTHQSILSAITGGKGVGN